MPDLISFKATIAAFYREPQQVASIDARRRGITVVGLIALIAIALSVGLFITVTNRDVGRVYTEITAYVIVVTACLTLFAVAVSGELVMDLALRAWAKSQSSVDRPGSGPILTPGP